MQWQKENSINTLQNKTSKSWLDKQEKKINMERAARLEKLFTSCKKVARVWEGGGERNLLIQKTHQWYGNLAEQQELKLEEFEYTKG